MSGVEAADIFSLCLPCKDIAEVFTLLSVHRHLGDDGMLPSINQIHMHKVCVSLSDGVSTFGGMEWWNGIVEWTTGMVECFIGHT